MNQDRKAEKKTVYVAGHTGMVGSALCRKFVDEGYDLVTPPRRVDLTKQVDTHHLISDMKPDWMIIAAAKVGGILANLTHPVDFIYDNLMVQCNLINAAYENNVSKILFLGSSCIYPKACPQPIKEEYLLSGYLEPTNTPYAVAKIAGIIMAQSYSRQFGSNFISVMPCNLYGPGDNFDLKDSHVIPAIMRKTHEALKKNASFVEIWGTGKPYREFLHVDDLADACFFLMRKYDSPELINIGSGTDLSIADLAATIKDVVGYTGEIRFNPAMPDGTPRKLLDISRLKRLGWKPSISLRDGLHKTYKWFLENQENIRKVK